MKILKLFLIASICIVSAVKAQNEAVLKAINEQIWVPFTYAFETNDYELFDSLHCTELVRISGDGKRVQGKETYIAGYKQRWQNNSQKQSISFRFLERLNNDNYASERGIYKLTINPNNENSRSYYGKFHVILKQQNGRWKISVDYDSSEGNTINEDTYQKAFAMEDYSKY